MAAFFHERHQNERMYWAVWEYIENNPQTDPRPRPSLIESTVRPVHLVTPVAYHAALGQGRAYCPTLKRNVSV